MQLIVQPGTPLRVKGGWSGIWILNTKAGTTKVNQDCLGKVECMICRNLLPGKDFRTDSIRCLEYYKEVKGDKNGEETSSSIPTKITSITRDNKSIGQPYLSEVRGGSQMGVDF